MSAIADNIAFPALLCCCTASTTPCNRWNTSAKPFVPAAVTPGTNNFRQSAFDSNGDRTIATRRPPPSMTMIAAARVLAFASVDRSAPATAATVAYDESRSTFKGCQKPQRRRHSNVVMMPNDDVVGFFRDDGDGVTRAVTTTSVETFATHPPPPRRFRFAPIPPSTSSSPPELDPVKRGDDDTSPKLLPTSPSCAATSRGESEPTRGLVISEQKSTVVTKLLANALHSFCVVRMSSGETLKMDQADYDGIRAPTIDLLSYFQRLVYYLPEPAAVCTCAMIYVDRLVRTLLPSPSFLLTHRNAYRLILVATLLAMKYISDKFYTNAYMASVGGIGIAELNALEMDFMIRMHFDFSASQKEINSVNSECEAKCKFSLLDRGRQSA